jgi:hypothetical protein
VFAKKITLALSNSLKFSGCTNQFQLQWRNVLLEELTSVHKVSGSGKPVVGKSIQAKVHEDTHAPNNTAHQNSILQVKMKQCPTDASTHTQYYCIKHSISGYLNLLVIN